MKKGARDVCTAYVIHKSLADWLQTCILVGISHGVKFLYELKTWFSAQTSDEEFCGNTGLTV